jgi:3-hydroxybutyryl-CoA dehydrogenase
MSRLNKVSTKASWGFRQAGGYYSWPNPSFAAADFLDVPDISKVPEIVSHLMPH